MGSEPGRFPGRVGLQQRVLPSYRVDFVDRLAAACDGGLSVYCGSPRPDEAILTGIEPSRAERVTGPARYPLGGDLLMIQAGLGEWIATGSFDAIIFEANPRYLSNWSAARSAHAAGAAVLGWGLGAPAVHQAGPKRWLWRRFLSRFDGLIAYSQRGAEEYARAGRSSHETFVAPNAVVGETLARPPRKRDEALRVLFVGRLQPRKRVDELIRACAQVNPPPALRIVGDGPAMSDLHRLAAELLPATEFTGALEGQRLRDSFSWADLLVLPGTGGLAVQQAMAHGLPTVVGEADGTVEDLVTSESGWQLPARSRLPALAAILQAATDDRVMLERKGEASRRRIEAGFNLETMVGAFIEALNATARLEQ